MDMDGAGKQAPHLIEERYNLEDALVVAGFFNSFLRHADVVKIANIAQIVNVIAPILTRGDEILLQSIFHVFEMYSQRRAGRSLRCEVRGPSYEGATNGRVHTVDSSAVLDGDTLHVFATNRSLDASAPLRICLADREIVSVLGCEIVTGDDPKAANSFEDPDRIRAVKFEDAKIATGTIEASLPAMSVVAMSFALG
jgi:alpha-N-arabinofuranosidase